MGAKVSEFLRSTTARLSLTYLIIIMVMSVSFSFVFYQTTSYQLSQQILPRSFYRQIEPDGLRPHVNNFLRMRINEGRHSLIIRLIILNAIVLALGALASYLLARRTLEPIEEAMEAQSQFASDASHELKTPLTAIRAGNEVALRKPGLTLKEAKRVIEQNNEDIIKLQALSEGLLRLSQKDSNVGLSRVPLKEVTAEAIGGVLPLAAAKQINIDNKTTAMNVLADRQSLQQVITILLDNAIKYSPTKSSVTVNNSHGKKIAYLIVSDQGIGIKASELPHIFQRFYQADPSRAKTQGGGYGLGLAIADKLIRQQHGEISVKSTPGHGSTFTIKLLLA